MIHQFGYTLFLEGHGRVSDLEGKWILSIHVKLYFLTGKKKKDLVVGFLQAHDLS